MMAGIKAPSPQRRRSGRDAAFEIRLGARLREARIAARMTQRALGDAVGINYQKLQKYELGKDRIAVSTLRLIAGALDIHPGAFFEEAIPLSVEGRSLDGTAQTSATLLQRIRDPRVAGSLRSLIAELGRSDPSAEDRAAMPISAKRRRVRLEPTRAVVDPLLKLLRGSGTGDAAATARLLGRALAEAEKMIKA